MSRDGNEGEKEQFCRLVLEEHASSGLSVRAFCKRESLSEPSFYSWRRKIHHRDSRPTRASSWQPNRPICGRVLMGSLRSWKGSLSNIHLPAICFCSVIGIETG